MLENVRVTSIASPYRGPKDKSSPEARFAVATFRMWSMVLAVGESRVRGVIGGLAATRTLLRGGERMMLQVKKD